MKRHDSLITLSREHHTALVEAKRLREATAQWSAQTLEASALRLLAFWREGLARHFLDEEELLLPLLARACPCDHPAILDTLSQHVAIRREVDELAEAVEDKSVPEANRLQHLGELLVAHVRFEETVLFPLIEEKLSPAQMARLKRKLSPD